MNKEDTVSHIANDKLGIETLKTRRLDRFDFHEVSVWNVKAALEAAFEAGVNSTLEKK